MRSIRTAFLLAFVAGLAQTPAHAQTDTGTPAGSQAQAQTQTQTQTQTRAQAKPDARAILAKIDSLQALIEYESALIEMRLFDGNREVRTRTLELKTTNSGGVKKALAVFTSPADIRGMSLLTIETGTETDQRLYLPALHRVQRITGSRRRERFAGSDFSYEDLRPRNADDYQSSILEVQPGAWVLSLVPSDQNSPYSRIETTVDSRRHVVTHARYFDRGDRLKKILISSNFSEARPGVWKPEIMVMTDVQENRRTELHYRNRDTDNTIPPETFTERHLKRGS